MFRTNTIKSFSTRNRKQTKEVPTTKKVVNQNKKKVPVLKAAIGIDQFSLEKNNGVITLTFKPQESVTFLSHTDGDEDIKLDVSTEKTYNDIILNYISDDKLNVLLDKLTLKQTSTEVDCNFLPFITGTSGERVKKITFTYKPDEDSDSTSEITIKIDTSSVSTLQVVNMSPSAEAITPVEWSVSNNKINFNGMVTDIASITGNYEKLKLTNFRYEEDAVSGNIETNLVVKNTMTGIISKMPLPIEVENDTKKWKITSINQAVNAGSDENPKLIGIDNEFTAGATASANDSSISFLGVELTDQQKTETYWKDFYVNKITRFSDQVFGFKFQGYRGTEKLNATEEVVTIAPATEVSIDSNVLTINFGNQEPGFLGETKEINMGTVESPNNVETIPIYLDQTKSAQIIDNIDYVSTIKLVVSNMRVITQQTEPSVDCFTKRIVSGTTVEPTHVTVYYLNASNEYIELTKPIEGASGTKNFTQEITNLNVIYGTVVEEGEGDNKKKLLTPAVVSDVWKNNKLDLKNVTFNTIKVH